MMRWHLLGVALAFALLAGCQKADSSDPKGSFEALAKRFIISLQKEFSIPITGMTKVSTMGGITFPSEPYEATYTIPNSYSIDVQKTDSLVSPYIALMRIEIAHQYRVTKSAASLVKFKTDATFRCAMQDDNWVLKSADAAEVTLKPGEEDSSPRRLDLLTAPGQSEGEAQNGFRKHLRMRRSGESQHSLAAPCNPSTQNWPVSPMLWIETLAAEKRTQGLGQLSTTNPRVKKMMNCLRAASGRHALVITG